MKRRMGVLSFRMDVQRFHRFQLNSLPLVLILQVRFHLLFGPSRKEGCQLVGAQRVGPGPVQDLDLVIRPRDPRSD